MYGAAGVDGLCAHLLTDAVKQLIFRVWFAKKIVGAKLYGVITVFVCRARSNHDDGQIFEFLVIADIAQ